MQVCKDCNLEECRRNREDRNAEERDEQKRYETEQKLQQTLEERAEKLRYLQWEAEMAEQRERLSQLASAAPTRTYDPRGSFTTSPTPVTQQMGVLNFDQYRGSMSRGRSSVFEDERQDLMPRLRQHNQTEHAAERLEIELEKLKETRKQTDAITKTALHNEKLMVATQQTDTKNQMEWADKTAKDLCGRAQKHIDKIQAVKSKEPPDSQVVGAAFLDIWRLVYEESKTAAIWITEIYPWLIHIFAQLLKPITEWIYATDIVGSLHRQAWKIEPKRCLQGILTFWGFTKEVRLHRLTITMIASLCRENGTTDVKQQNMLFTTAIQNMSNIYVEHSDNSAYRNFT
jgi:hypothetical protein